MANYPNSLDSFNNPTGADSLSSPSHALQHADANDAIEALEAKIGIGPSTAGSATAGQVLTAGTGGTTSWTTPVATNDAWTSYTPVLTATTTNPTLGTSPYVSGEYIKIGKTVIGSATIVFGTSGTNAGSGNYLISLPIARYVVNENVLGSVVMRDASAAYIGVTGTFQGYGSDATKGLIVYGGSVFAANATSPWAWAATDQIFVNFMYQVA